METYDYWNDYQFAIREESYGESDQGGNAEGHREKCNCQARDKYRQLVSSVVDGLHVV